MSAWKWESSETTAQVIPAFVAALQAADDVARNKRADIETKTGGHVRYSYADLDAVLESIKPVLVAHGLALTQAPASDGVHTLLLHSSGEWLAFPPLEVRAAQATPQAQGSAITYARRYAATAVLNVATEDDDGQAAAKPPPAPAAASQSQLRALGSQLRKLTGSDREKGLAFIAEHAGRQVASSKELTTQEAAAVINALADALSSQPAAEPDQADAEWVSDAAGSAA